MNELFARLLAQDRLPPVLQGSVDLEDMPNSHGGSLMSALINGAKSGFTLPGDVATGKLDPYSDKGLERAWDMAGLGMTCGVAGVPKGNATLGSGPIRAYHGSPHDFDRFSLSKIGTGEGAQAYGHGLYFAEKEATAKAYRDALSNRGADGFANAHLNAQNLVSRVGGDADYAASVLREQMQNLGPKDFNYDRLKATLEAIETGKHAQPLPPAGKMYEVGIHADPAKFLDWDKPLHRQTDPVRGALEGLGIKTEPQGQWKVEPAKTGDSFILRNVWGEAAGRFKSRDAAEAKAVAMTDAHNTGGVPLTYQRLGGNHVYGGLDKGVASQALREAGIPGIKYLDQGSRGAAEGSRNYVTFSDDIVEILRKYGLAGLVAIPPAYAATTGQGEQ